MATASRCRAKTRQPTPSSQAAIWVTDLMLRQTYEQFQRRTLITSSLSGAHNNSPEARRRRLGRRQLTAFLEPPSPYQQSWYFELLGNKNEWTWHPPSNAEQRRQKEAKITVESVLEKITRWLEASDLDKPFLDPPVDDAPSLDTAPSAAERGALLTEVDSLRREVASFQKIEDGRLKHALNACCKQLQSRIDRLDFSANDVAALLLPSTHTDWHPDLTRKQHTMITHRLAKTMFDMLFAVHKKAPTTQTLEALQAIVTGIYAMPPSHHQFRLFSFLMHVPLSGRDAVLDEEGLKYILEAFVNIHGDYITALPMHEWHVRIAKFSETFNKFPTSVLKSLVDGGNVWSNDSSRQRDLTWLLLHALSTKESVTDVLVMAQTFRERHGRSENEGFTSAEARALVMARMRAGGFVSRDWVVDMHKQSARYSREASRWTALAATFEDPTFQGNNAALRLQDFVQFQPFDKMVTRFDVQRWHLQALILSWIDPEASHLGPAALRVMERVAGFTNAKSINVRFFEELEHVFHILRTGGKLLMLGKGQDTSALPMDTVRKRLEELLVRMACRYMQSKELSNRQALKGVSLCLQASETIARPVSGLGGQPAVGSPAVLRVVSEVVLQDLEHGQYGRSARLQWFVGKVRQYHGECEADKVQKTLHGWRNLLAARSAQAWTLANEGVNSQPKRKRRAERQGASLSPVEASSVADETLALDTSTASPDPFANLSAERRTS
ncbi:uncharacterized protein F5Z01DRAFT_432907 [Emericellopsis atlantica]|uniref:Uncharacterized protein n=1 Tax=Emericellopsis atlantica TaxID=2614577 RepID=A0A9P7ZEE3_9HYPO|nr:uncharacterized protein F5Z01DRAFT_432907 [Emericellopsis atlantica]KAG9250025.1 hypothetical protein F5Z01DRAFT_432907 [Emericellopsis atlantica]